MAMAISMQCGVRCDEYRACAKRGKNARRVPGRLAALAVVFAALVLMAYGQTWLLQEAPATPSELATATYAVGALSGSAVVAEPNANDIHPNANDPQPDDKDIAR